MNNVVRKELMDKIAQALDITPDMFNKAMSVANGLANYVGNQGYTVEVYKQGSFKLGTIIKPYKKDRDSDYDMDLVIQYADKKEKHNHSEIKRRLGDALKKSYYKDYLDKEGRRCWTLIYPKTKLIDASFHIDLLPCLDEDGRVKETISPIKYRSSTIAITNIKDKESKPIIYDWQSSNPKGYIQWFHELNTNKYNSARIQDRKRIFESNRILFESVEKVGDEYTRTPLQKVVQILKRHRDVMYANNIYADYKPISIIITTLVGKIVEENSIVYNSTYELLSEILFGLEFYAGLLTTGMTSEFSEDYKNKKLITKHVRLGKVFWSIQNPADSNDNLANRWNEDAQYSIEFFKWIKQAKNDLIDMLEYSKDDVLAKIKYCLGEDVAMALKGFDFEHGSVAKPVEDNAVLPKPYGYKNGKI